MHIVNGHLICYINDVPVNVKNNIFIFENEMFVLLICTGSVVALGYVHNFSVFSYYAI